MRLFFHYYERSFSNCYVLCSEVSPLEAAPLEAIIIDPPCMDEKILDFIEGNGYTPLGVLLTHDHLTHTRGLRTLKRIYDTEIYAVNRLVMNHRTTMVKDGETLHIGPFAVEVISVPGHSADSAVFKIERLLFTGDAMSAGLVGKTVSSYGATVQMTALRSKIFALPGDFVILPGHGPPSTLEAERHFNAGVELYEQSKIRRPRFTMD